MDDKLRRERNRRMGQAIGTVVGCGLRTIVYIEAASYVGVLGVVLIKQTSKYGFRAVKYVSKVYARKDYSSENIFSDAVTASFNAY